MSRWTSLSLKLRPGVESSAGDRKREKKMSLLMFFSSVVVEQRRKRPGKKKKKKKTRSKKLEAKNSKQKTLTDQALHVVDRPLRVGRRLVLRGVADQPLPAVLREGHVRRRDPVPLVVGDDLDAPALVDADARVGRAEVDADDGAEGLVLFGGFFRLLGVGLLGAGGEAEGRGGERWSCFFCLSGDGEREKKGREGGEGREEEEEEFLCRRFFFFFFSNSEETWISPSTLPRPFLSLAAQRKALLCPRAMQAHRAR